MSIEFILQFMKNQNYSDFKQIQLLEFIGTIYIDCIITILSLTCYLEMTQISKMMCYFLKNEIHYNPTMPCKMDFLRIGVVNSCLFKKTFYFNDACVVLLKDKRPKDIT